MLNPIYCMLMKPDQNHYQTPSLLRDSLQAIENYNYASQLYRQTKDEALKMQMEQAGQTFRRLEKQLAVPDVKADMIRLGFISQFSSLNDQILDIHRQGLYPDLYRDSETPLRLAADLLDSMKALLVSEGANCPLLELSPGSEAWKDEAISAICRDVVRKLEATRFTSRLDALQSFRQQMALLNYTFNLLSMTGNLGKNT